MQTRFYSIDISVIILSKFYVVFNVFIVHLYLNRFIVIEAMISYHRIFFFNILHFIQVVVFNAVVRHFIDTHGLMINMLENVICYHETCREL